MRIADSQINMGAARQYFHNGNSRNGSFMEYVSESSSVGNAEGADGISRASRMQNQLLHLLVQRIFRVYLQQAGSNSIRMLNRVEYEDTTFYAQGKVLTEDGRQISFNLDVLMSRSFLEYTDIPLMQLSNALCDPLVIHLDLTPSNISDQKFRFDLDADGKEETISTLGRGSGFLALDRNQDGVINDGSELFGTKSGDGFAELADYDADGNGWIDENDDIFSRLKVWCKGENGEDILMDLKEAGVGAVYLGSQATEFSMYDMNGGLNGVVRQTGFFLKENGGAGTIQHIDLNTQFDTTLRNRMNNGFSEVSAQTHEEAGRLSSGQASSISLNRQSESISLNRQPEKINRNRQAEKNYRDRMARNKRIRKERLERQRTNQKALQKHQEERLEKKREQKRLERKEISDEVFAKLLEDR